MANGDMWRYNSDEDRWRPLVGFCEGDIIMIFGSDHCGPHGGMTRVHVLHRGKAKVILRVNLVQYFSMVET